MSAAALPAAASLRGVAGEGGVVGRWFTPPRLAKKFAEWSRVEGIDVLDLGCGEFALTRAALQAGAKNVTGADIITPDSPIPTGAAYVDAEKLVVRLGNVDVAISNPPWEGDSIAKMIEEAFVYAKRVCVLVPIKTLASMKRHKGIWSKCRLTRLAVCSRRPRFAASGGTDDVCFIELINAAPSKTLAIEIEFLTDEWNGGDE